MVSAIVIDLYVHDSTFLFLPFYSVFPVWLRFNQLDVSVWGFYVDVTGGYPITVF